MTNTREEVFMAGEAILKLQAHIHAIGSGEFRDVLNNAYFTQSVNEAKELVGSWLIHPKGREWELNENVDRFIKHWRANNE